MCPVIYSHMALTDRQREVLTYIRDFKRRMRFAPTVGEIADNFTVKRGSIVHILDLLEKKKYLRRSPPRGYRNITLIARTWA